MSIIIINYGSGNLCSVENALRRVAGDTPLKVSARADEVAQADHIILPGVGAFADCAAGLAALDGMNDALNARVIKEGRPFLGICVGMQLMCQASLETIDITMNDTPITHQGLGWIEGEIVELNDKGRKIPHMGWNNLSLCGAHPVLGGLDGADVYFVHKYAPRLKHAKNELARVDYQGAITASIGRDNLFGTQFHPEKSQAAGLHLISNFLAWHP